MVYKKISAFAFFALIITISLLTLCVPKGEVSELENRKREKMPKISLSTLADKSFTNNFEKFLSDRMIGREQLSSAKTHIELALGKTLINGVYVTNDRLLEEVLPPKDNVIKASADAINKFAEKYKSFLTTSIMLVPTATEIYKNDLPPFATSLDQAAFIKDFYKMVPSCTGVDVYSSLSSSADKYIYYKTDHHWTSYGAYIGYNSLAKALGFKAAGIDLFQLENASHDFLGTLYSKVLYGEQLKDSIDLYHFSGKQNEVFSGVSEVIKYTQNNTQAYPSIFFKEHLNTHDKYSVFLDGNNAITKIIGKAKNGKRLLLFRDSYSNALMQFLPLHYEEITLVDTRYLVEPLSKYVNIYTYNQALFLYNVSGFTTDETVKKVSIY